MYQQRFALSMENKKLRWQVTSIQQEKMMKDGECDSLFLVDFV